MTVEDLLREASKKMMNISHRLVHHHEEWSRRKIGENLENETSNSVYIDYNLSRSTVWI